MCILALPFIPEVLTLYFEGDGLKKKPLKDTLQEELR